MNAHPLETHAETFRSSKFLSFSQIFYVNIFGVVAEQNIKGIKLKQLKI